MSILVSLVKLIVLFPSYLIVFLKSRTGCPIVLLLNDDKTEFFVAANQRLVNILSDTHITICNTVIRPSRSAKTLVSHSTVPSLCLITSLQYAKLSSSVTIMRIFIDETICHHAITSRLDYANSLLKGSSGKEINRLQRIQNRVAKLHWLSVHKRIDFKMLTYF